MKGLLVRRALVYNLDRPAGDFLVSCGDENRIYHMAACKGGFWEHV
jgi:hypothetical protein